VLPEVWPTWVSTRAGYRVGVDVMLSPGSARSPHEERLFGSGRLLVIRHNDVRAHVWEAAVQRSDEYGLDGRDPK